MIWRCYVDADVNDRIARGLWFLSAFTSSLLGGVGSDAEHIAEQIAAHQPDRRPAAEVLAAARRTGRLN